MSERLTPNFENSGSKSEDEQLQYSIVKTSERFANRAIQNGLANEPTAEEKQAFKAAHENMDIEEGETLIAIESSLVANLGLWNELEAKVNKS